MKIAATITDARALALVTTMAVRLTARFTASYSPDARGVRADWATRDVPALVHAALAEAAGL